MRRVPVASAVGYPAAGRRRFVLLLVLHCPFCRYAHSHRGAEHGGRLASVAGFMISP